MSDDQRNPHALHHVPDHYKKIFLGIGELLIVEEPTFVHTILGSCLSMIFYHRGKIVSAISHAQVPAPGGRYSCYENCPVKCHTAVDDSCDFKYVTCSFDYMIKWFNKKTIPLAEVEIRLFGGANVIPYKTADKTVGEKNIDTALDLIKKHGLTVIGKELGGEKGMNLYFYSDTGKVFIRRHKKSFSDYVDEASPGK